MTSFLGRDVVARAIMLVQDSKVQHDAAHSPYCPWCACATAKSELDREYGITLVDCLAGSGDTPLIKARWALNPWNHIDEKMVTQDAALDILQTALGGMDD